MDLNTVTVSDFRVFFRRDFPYLPVYDNAALYNSGVKTYLPSALLFYLCAVDGTMGVPPNTDPTKWSKIPDEADNYIQDEDITKAFAEAQTNLNQALLGDDAEIRMAYLYLTAHYLCNDIRAALRGIMATANFVVTSRNVGNVSEQYGIPETYLKDPVLAFYTQSAYGLKFLSLILPNLVGNMQAVCGATNP